MKTFSRRTFLGVAVAFGLGGRAWGTAERNPARQFSIAVINDTHIVDAPSADILREAVKHINTLSDIRFIVVAGDTSHESRREQFELAKQALDGLARPYMVLPGNHDVVSNGGLAYTEYTRHFGARNWVHQDNGWFFVGLDSCDGIATDVSIPVVRLAWLKQQLRKIPADSSVALFAHHPFNPNSIEHRVRNADKVLEMFLEHRLRLVACGHWHGNQVETENGILYTTTACCSSTRQNFDFTLAKGFRLFHFREDEIETEFVPVDMPV